MGPDGDGEVTRILKRLRSGDRDAVADLMPVVYDELRKLAAVQMADERPGHTLQPTALVHEAFLRLVRRENLDWQDRGQFYRAAAALMRRILVNHARDRKRLKRGGETHRVPLDDVVAAFEERTTDLLALDEALTRLETFDARHAELVELRFFGGLSVEETARTLGVSERTVKADWSLARRWLWRQLAPDR